MFKRFETYSTIEWNSQVYAMKSIHGYYFIVNEVDGVRYRLDDYDYPTLLEAQYEVSKYGGVYA